MGIAVSGNGSASHGSAAHSSARGSAPAGRGPACRRDVYLRADATGVVGDRGALRRGRPAVAGRFEPTRPSAGLVRYDERPRHGSRGSRVAQSARPSHDRVGSRFGGIASVVATVVVTVGLVVGLDALATLTAAPDGVPTETAAVRVRSGETLSDVASRVAPGASVGRVVVRIMELNEMSSAGVRAGQTLLAPVSVGG